MGKVRAFFVNLDWLPAMERPVVRRMNTWVLRSGFTGLIKQVHEYFASTLYPAGDYVTRFSDLLRSHFGNESIPLDWLLASLISALNCDRFAETGPLSCLWVVSWILPGRTRHGF